MLTEWAAAHPAPDKAAITAVEAAAEEETAAAAAAVEGDSLTGDSGYSEVIGGAADGSGSCRGDPVVLNRSAYGMGDTVAISYAQGLRRMQKQGVVVSELHLVANWLTGDGAAAICSSLFNMDRLQVWDIPARVRFSPHDPPCGSPTITMHDWDFPTTCARGWR